MQTLGCFIAISYLILVAGGRVKFTNVKCQEIDKSFMKVDQCYLKVLRRGIVSLSIHATFFKLPLTNLTVNLSIHKRENGYKPFLYDVTLDFCQFLKRRTLFPLVKIVFGSFERASNFNHSCPFNHDLVVNNLVLDHKDFRFLPLPDGDYMFHVKLGAYNDWKGHLYVYNSMNDF